MKNQSVSSSSSSSTSDSLTRPDLLSSEKHFSERVRTPSPLAGWYIAQPTMGKGDGWIKNAHKARYNMFCFFCLLFLSLPPTSSEKHTFGRCETDHPWHVYTGVMSGTGAISFPWIIFFRTTIFSPVHPLRTNPPAARWLPRKRCLCLCVCSKEEHSIAHNRNR